MHVCAIAISMERAVFQRDAQFCQKSSSQVVRVECELCCGDCQGDRTECKQQEKSSEHCCGMTRNCASQHASRRSQDQLRCNLTLSQA